MMKKIFKTVFIALVVSGGIVSAQVGINTTTPAPGSILDIESTDKAVVLPRVSISDLNTIAPVTGGAEEGMVVYNTNDATRKGIKFWDGMRWQGTTEVIRDEILFTRAGEAAGQRSITVSTQDGFLLDNMGNPTTTATNGAPTFQRNVYTTSITLTKSTVVEVIFQSDVSIRNRNGNVITDNDARLILGRIIMTNGVSLISRNLISDTVYYSNSNGSDGLIGNYYVRGNGFITLPAGNHNIEYALFVNGGINQGTAAEFGRSPQGSYVQVILHN